MIRNQSRIPKIMLIGGALIFLIQIGAVELFFDLVRPKKWYEVVNYRCSTAERKNIDWRNCFENLYGEKIDTSLIQIGFLSLEHNEFSLLHKEGYELVAKYDHYAVGAFGRLFKRS